jgi:hypothetical protein
MFVCFIIVTVRDRNPLQQGSLIHTHVSKNAGELGNFVSLFTLGVLFVSFGDRTVINKRWLISTAVCHMNI